MRIIDCPRAIALAIGTLTIFNSARGGEPEFRRGLNLAGITSGLAFSPDGRVIASCNMGSREIDLWDGSSGKLLATLEAHKRWVARVVFSPNSKRLISIDSDAIVCLWDVETKKMVSSFKGEYSVSQVAIGPDGKTLAAGGQGNTIRLWDLDTGKSIAKLKGHTDIVSPLGFSPDGKTLCSSGLDRAVRIWDLEKKTSVIAFECEPDSDEGIVAVKFCDEGQGVLATGRDRIIRKWNAKSGKTSTVSIKPANELRAMAFSPDNKLLATSDKRNIVQLWDVGTGNELGRIKMDDEEDVVSRIVFSPDGKTMALGINGLMQLISVPKTMVKGK
jgi:WD40 repeat protein